MASYRIISPTLWQDKEFRALSPSAGYMLVQLRLMAENIIALYRPDWELIGELLGADRDGRKQLLAELGRPKESGHPWVLHDDGWAWVLNGFRHEFGVGDDGKPRKPNEKHLVAAARALAVIPRHVKLIGQFAAYYGNGHVSMALDEILIPYQCPIDTSGPGPGPGPGSGPGTGTGISASGQEPSAQPPVEKPKPKRPLNAQAQAVDVCLKAYVAGREAVGQPHPGEPDPGPVIKWLGRCKVGNGAVAIFAEAVRIAVESHKLSPRWHGYPMTVGKFVRAIPEMNGARLDAARAEARRHGSDDSAADAERVRVQRNAARMDAERAKCIEGHDDGVRHDCGYQPMPRCVECPRRTFEMQDTLTGKTIPPRAK